MTESLVTYLQDHLAGARFAVTLLGDLSAQENAPDVARFAAELLSQIEADRAVLEGVLHAEGHESSAVKEAAAWTAQKASRMKLSLAEPLGRFEAIEMLTLGVLGKLALWTALREVPQLELTLENFSLEELIRRAESQAELLETWRRKLAVEALATAASH